ncbi:MAG: NUDIX pyrophosphatase [Oscillospiraceae bacterium]|nr:NUDIX pyrophosphatase [Oscillospiraceae bacterium]
MRAPFQILAIPYRKNPELQYCVLHRADLDQWQFASGGGEDDETPIEAAFREILEETAIKTENIITLKSTAHVPANVIAEHHRKMWSKDTYVIPEYSFAFECLTDIIISDEHAEFEWLGYEAALARLTWDSNKTALYELNCRLLVDLQY